MREYIEGDKLEFEDGTSFILTSREACILNYVTLEYPTKEQKSPREDFKDKLFAELVTNESEVKE